MKTISKKIMNTIEHKDSSSEVYHFQAIKTLLGKSLQRKKYVRFTKISSWKEVNSFRF